MCYFDSILVIFAFAGTVNQLLPLNIEVENMVEYLSFTVRRNTAVLQNTASLNIVFEVELKGIDISPYPVNTVNRQKIIRF